MQNMDKMPGMGDVPILSALFRSKKFQNNETELAIFVRPVVVSSDNEDIQRRVMRSQAIVDSTFEQQALLNVPINPTVEKAQSSLLSMSSAPRSKLDVQQTFTPKTFYAKEIPSFHITKKEKLIIRPLVSKKGS